MSKFSKKLKYLFTDLNILLIEYYFAYHFLLILEIDSSLRCVSENNVLIL